MKPSTSLLAGLLLATAQPAHPAEPQVQNPFGMQLRKSPATATEAWAPSIVHPAPTNESSLVARKSGAVEIFHATKPSSDSISVIRSTDGGRTWSDPEVAFPVPGKIYYAVMALEARDGRMHAVFHVAGKGAGGYRGRLYDIYHIRSGPDGKTWEKPTLIVPGYVGSIRGFVQLKSGRLVLAVGRANPDRMEAPKEGTDYGWNDTVVFTSDDDGANWKESPDILKLAVPGKGTTRYGAIEPALVELADGRVWMLIRSRDGRFWESYSADGSRWSEPKPTALITSDSPASFVRLEDGAIVLLLNACRSWSKPHSYAYGGREVLQAAISRDEGKTWSGFRNVLEETNVPAEKGDRGTAYASAAVTKDGKISMVSGQGEGKRAVVLFDPKWLDENRLDDDLSQGPVFWTQFGAEGLRAEAGTEKYVAIPLSPEKPSGAAWNFPAARSGKISLGLWIPETAREPTICLADHFSRVDDGANGTIRFPLDDFPRGRWVDATIEWTPENARLTAGGREFAPTGPVNAAPHGLLTLRFDARGDAELKVRNLSFEKK